MARFRPTLGDSGRGSGHPNYMRGSEEERFWAKVDKGDGTGCWLWTAACNGVGYGLFAVRPPEGGRYIMVLAHRYAYKLLVGPIPDGHALDHVKANGCASTACVKPIADEFGPTHLEAVTRQENILRGKRPARDARTHCGKGHPWVPENTYWSHDKNGNDKRQCRKCSRESWRRRQARAAAS